MAETSDFLSQPLEFCSSDEITDELCRRNQTVFLVTIGRSKVSGGICKCTTFRSGSTYEALGIIETARMHLLKETMGTPE